MDNTFDRHSLQINVIHQEESFIVVEKPSGMLSVPGKGIEHADCVCARVIKLQPNSIAMPAVHRLDMDTSGLLVLAFTKEAHRILSIQFQERMVHKRYEALIDGIVTSEGGIIELPFRLDVDNRPRQIYDEIHGKVGITQWHNLGIENGCTRVSFYPHTGRTHQLRVHSAHAKGLGAPIVGDPLYGRGKSFGQLKLHACELAFYHPQTGERMRFNSIPPF
ncbi:MAG: RluA family pseudouridine synthase [Lentisphaeria bacterium]